MHTDFESVWGVVFCFLFCFCCVILIFSKIFAKKFLGKKSIVLMVTLELTMFNDTV